MHTAQPPIHTSKIHTMKFFSDNIMADMTLYFMLFHNYYSRHTISVLWTIKIKITKLNVGIFVHFIYLVLLFSLSFYFSLIIKISSLTNVNFRVGFSFSLFFFSTISCWNMIWRFFFFFFSTWRKQKHTELCKIYDFSFNFYFVVFNFRK